MLVFFLGQVDAVDQSGLYSLTNLMYPNTGFWVLLFVAASGVSLVLFSLVAVACFVCCTDGDCALHANEFLRDYGHSAPKGSVKGDAGQVVGLQFVLVGFSNVRVLQTWFITGQPHRISLGATGGWVFWMGTALLGAPITLAFGSGIVAVVGLIMLRGVSAIFTKQLGTESEI